MAGVSYHSVLFLKKFLFIVETVLFVWIKVKPYLIFVIFFTRTKFLENKIYTEKMRKLRQNTQ